MRVGVIGAGYWGANVVRVCHELGILDSVCDASAAIRSGTAERYPDITIAGDVPALLRRDVDAIAIAAPAAVHAELALEAIAAGKHVFVEKPLAMTVEDGGAVVRAARAGERTLFVGHVLLYHPAVRRLLGLLQEGAIGEVRHVRTRRTSWGKLRAHENVWWSFAPHDVALILEIFGEVPQSVRGMQSGFIRPAIADFVHADLQFTSGRSAHIEASWLDPDKTSRLDVFGEKGVLTFSDSRDGARLTITPCGDRKDERGAPQLWRDASRSIDFTPAEPLTVEMRTFIDAVENGRTPMTDGEEGLRVVQVLAMLGSQDYAHPSMEAFV